MLGEGLSALLASTPAIADLLGAGSPPVRPDNTTGIFPAQMPEASPLPVIVYSQIAGENAANSLDGANALHSARYQFSCYGKNYADSKRLAKALRDTLEGLHATLLEGTEVDNILLNMESDTFEEAPFIYHTPVDFEILFREAGPE